MKDSERIEQLEYAVAVAYQLAGACGAPKRFLDYFSDVLDEWDDIEDPLPVSCDEFNIEGLNDD